MGSYVIAESHNELGMINTFPLARIVMLLLVTFPAMLNPACSRAIEQAEPTVIPQQSSV